MNWKGPHVDQASYGQTHIRTAYLDRCIYTFETAAAYAHAVDLLAAPYLKKSSDPGEWLHLRHPLAQNYALAIELFLKAYLLAKGGSLTTNKGFGHRLLDLERACVADGLRLSAALDLVIASLDEHYGAHDFRYPVPGGMITVPPPSIAAVVEGAARTLRLSTAT